MKKDFEIGLSKLVGRPTIDISMAITVIREYDDNSSCCALYAEKTYFLSRYWPIQYKILYSSIHIKWKLKRHPLDMSFGSFHFAEACGITNIKITLVLQLIIRRFLINDMITCCLLPNVWELREFRLMRYQTLGILIPRPGKYKSPYNTAKRYTAPPSMILTYWHSMTCWTSKNPTPWTHSAD